MRSANSLKAAQILADAYDVNLSNNSRRTYIGQVDSAQPQRLYRLRFVRSSSIDLSLTGLKANASLALLDPSGKTLRRSNQAGNTSELLRHSVSPGTYYVRVSGDRGNTGYRLKLAIGDSPKGQLSTASKNSSPFVQRVVELTNAQRAQAGLQPLRLNAKLTAAAYTHSRDMALNDFFNHKGSDGSRSGDRISRVGYGYANVGENIAAGYATPEAVLEGWMNSPGHRANILYPNVKEIGVGFFFLANDSGKAPYRYYWTQDFATPAQ